MLHNAVVTFDDAALSATDLVSVIEQTGYGSSLPEPDRSALDEQEAQDRAQEADYRDLRLKAGVSLTAAAFGMLASMPLMGGTATSGHDHGATVPADPFLAWTHRVIDPWLCSRAALALQRRPRRAGLDALRPDGGGDDLGRRALLRARLEGLPPPRRRHEHARRRWAPARRSPIRSRRPPRRTCSRAGVAPTSTTRRCCSSSRWCWSATCFESRAKRQSRPRCAALGDCSRRRRGCCATGASATSPWKSGIVGDLVLVRPGERRAGRWRGGGGASALDESMLTGESLPVEKARGRCWSSAARSIAPARFASA